MISMTAATDQLAASARDNMPTAIDTARRLLAKTGDRDTALAALTMCHMKLSHAGVAAIAADALLRLVEVER